MIIFFKSINKSVLIAKSAGESNIKQTICCVQHIIYSMFQTNFCKILFKCHRIVVMK